VFDGHSTHINSQIIAKAQEENITIIKLPPHTTDRLQPLDVCRFHPLKAKWDKAIAKWQRGNEARWIKKGEFVDLVGSVWNDVFNSENIHSAFRKTGIYPVSRDIYQENLFDPCLLAAFKRMEALKTQQAEKASTPRKQAPVFSPLFELSPACPQPSTSGTQLGPLDQSGAGRTAIRSLTFPEDCFSPHHHRQQQLGMCRFIGIGIGKYRHFLEASASVSASVKSKSEVRHRYRHR